MIGIRVDPPTKMISSISEVDKPASSKAFFTGLMERRTNSFDNCSNFERVKVVTKCLGPEAVAVT